jgi:hypothetical protein
MKNSMRLVTLSLGLAAAMAASAQNSFYGGDIDHVNGLAAEKNTSVSDARVYDDFTLGSATTVQSVFGNFYSSTNITGLYYEIRSGVSQGNGGTLISSGSLSATATDTGMSDFGYEVYKVLGSITGLNLAAGTYHLGLAAIGDGTGYAYLATTSGTNGVGGPISNDNAFFDSSSYGANFDSSMNQGSGLNDFSMGVNGTQAVPEPTSMAALGLGALGFLRRRAVKK